MTRTEKQSFLSCMIGNDSYKSYKKFSWYIFLIGTILLLVFGGLSLHFYNSFINWFVQLITGTSLLFIIYVGAAILVLDKTVDVQVDDKEIGDCTHKHIHRPISYKITFLWLCVLILVGFTAIIYTNRYRNNYELDCQEYHLDKNKGIYHLYTDCNNYGTIELPLLKGHSINKKKYKLCSSCKDLYDENKQIETEQVIDKD